MQSSILFLISLLSVVVNAHFQLQFPAPRGVFVENDEPNFCDGYNTAASNRTAFPLTGGFFTLNSEHPKWTSEVLLSTASNPTSFDNFSSVVPFFQLNGEGIFCIPLDFSKTNATGLKDGQNVTIQVRKNLSINYTVLIAVFTVDRLRWRRQYFIPMRGFDVIQQR
ncbi:hypothetical protein BDQ12DRAFT_679389 [Crucibulum laeve]|uniref:Copper acquisition factor BIM1-like domain-containing protein n=1 Tax=Crucibulum laeve TaxID=68775 RepID=A0A5C3M9K3_9AGAR|nr:hypothetical protein BDQ12DRAFT_679389 [Crucibulum laeve]